MNEIMIRMQHIFNLPLSTRCEEIRRMIAESSQKELQTIFPILVENIFAVNNQLGWNLCSLSPVNYPTDHEYVLHFLSSQGPMFNLIYRLMSDCYLKYEFPLTLLPPNVKKVFEEDVIQQFYLDKIQIDHHTKMVTALTLNPFEYYIFHFASHLVSPFVKASASLPTDSVYITLCEDYLLCFLPCNKSEVLPPVDHHVVKSPVPRPQVITVPTRTPTIFRQTILNKANPPASFHSSPTAQVTPHLEVWRTETVIQAFLDLWLTYGSNDMSSSGRIRDLPSNDRIRIVRLLVKHFHYFANAANSDMTSMGEIRSTLRQVTRFRIYTFLRRTIQDWPLDSSFRGVLETWLSYIQPWRYTHFDNRVRNHMLGAKESEETFYGVDRHLWSSFIVENLFAYTIIFQQLIPRFTRLDLTTPRNAHMLYRVSKVFAQPNLNILLAEAESCLNEETRWNRSGTMSYSSENLLRETIPDLVIMSNTVATLGSKWSAILRQQLQELEGPHYEYTYLFDYNSGKIDDLVKMVLETTIASHVLLKCEEKQKQKKTKGFMPALRDIFSSSTDTAEFSIEERKKVVTYLEASLKNLCLFFKVPVPELPDLSGMGLQELSSLVKPEYNSLYQLTDTSAFGLEGQPPGSLFATRFRRAPISCEGDPDLQPVRSDECGLLVHLLHFIALQVNQKYRDDLARLYYREDFLGRIVRQVLCSPLVVRTYDKSAKVRFTPLVEHLLPPRLSLRRLARIHDLFCFGLYMLFTWVWGCHPAVVLMVCFCVWCLYILIRAIFDSFIRTPEREAPVQPMNVSDISDRDVSMSF